MTDLIKEIKKFCKENYLNGYDRCVECWDESDYQEWINDYNINSVESFIESYSFMIERAEDIISTAF